MLPSERPSVSRVREIRTHGLKGVLPFPQRPLRRTTSSSTGLDTDRRTRMFGGLHVTEHPPIA